MNKIFGLLLIIFSYSYIAQAAPAQIIVETAVYKSSDFDSDVIVYFSAKKKIQASKKIYKGKNFGSFRKVKISKSKYGFVSDVDVKLLVQIRKQKKRLKKRLKYLKYKNQLADSNIYFNSYTGLGLTFSRAAYSDKTPFYAFSFHLIGRTSVLPKLPLSLSISYFPDIPTHYKDEKYNTDINKKPKGYVIFGDISYPIILSDYNKLLVYLSFGTTFRLVKGTIYKGIVSGRPAYNKTINKIHLGLLASAGILWQLSNNTAVKIDTRYNYSNLVFFEELQLSLAFKY